MEVFETMFKKRSVFVNILVLIFALGILPVFVQAWETPLVIAGEPNHNYFKPEIAFGPGGEVYIAYRDKDNSGGNSDIFLCRYDGKEMTYENVSAGASFFARYKCYESDIRATSDGRIHVAWITHDRNAPGVHYVKYRYKDGSVWSEIINLGTLSMSNNDTAFDLRMGVDHSGNVHVVLYKEKATDICYFAKYGDTIMPMEVIGNSVARQKHPDLTVDDNYVHIIWMEKTTTIYEIMYQKRENRIGGAVFEIRQLSHNPGANWSSQKSRIAVGSNGLFHFAEFRKQGTVKKLRYYKELANGQLTNPETVSHPEKLQLYHYATLVVRDNAVLCTMQMGSSSGGQGVFYNWQKNGVWQGYAEIPNTGGALHDSADLSADGQIAAVAYQRYEDAIMLASSEPITASGTLEATFTHPTMVFWGDNVTFDASQCAALNPDYTIATYEWNFGDGTTITTSTPTITHSFNTYGTGAAVTLKITAVTGEMGNFKKDIHIHALYNGIVSSVTPQQIRTLFFHRPANEIQWTENPKNAAAGYPAITGYEIWRAPVSGLISGDSYVLLAEVSAGVSSFLDYQGVQANVQYVYSIRSVDSEGHKSPFNNL
jgi:hypothetical protein